MDGEIDKGCGENHCGEGLINRSNAESNGRLLWELLQGSSVRASSCPNGCIESQPG